jgi:hypothetical protein
MAIQEGYLSTSVRWALFKADHPDAEIKFTEATAEQVGIPASFSKKDEKFCVATITRHPMLKGNGSCPEEGWIPRHNL